MPGGLKGEFYCIFGRTYEGQRPVLLVSDVDLIRQILVKDFWSFSDRQAPVYLKVRAEVLTNT